MPTIINPLIELKKNCPPELIIYIVGSKADLDRERQVTSDLARLSLPTWFPPPRPPTPPPVPQPSISSYMRPRFTSFTSIRSVPTPPTNKSSPERPSQLDLPTSGGVPLRRSNTGSGLSRPKAPVMTRSASSARVRSLSPQQHRYSGGWNEIVETSSNSINEDDEDALDDDEQEWGLHKGMELFEVSSKDDFGQSLACLRHLYTDPNLFQALIHFSSH